jgi:hypothetical protein
MSDNPYPVIQVFVSPREVHKGQLISISANIFDKNSSQPMAFDLLYMQIIDEDGTEVWPTSVIEKGVSSFHKLISTEEMQQGKTYTVRISPSRKLRPIGETRFKIKDELLPLGLLVPGKSLIPHLLLSVATSLVVTKVLSDIVEPKDPILKIAWLIFRTQRDTRVCKYCKVHEDERFRPNDPDLPKIPVHLKCRCHFDIITEEDEQEIYNAYYIQTVTMQQLDMIDAVNAVHAVNAV